MECIFCKISKGEIPSYTIYEDDVVKVFLDVNPDHNGHTLIVPKKHYLDLYGIPLDVLSHINKVSIEISKLLTDKLHADGITLVQNNGLPQAIKHYHMHLIPKYKSEEKISVEEIYGILKD